MLMRDILSDRGLILVHFDDNIGHEAKLLMDEVFGERNYRGEIIWQLGSGSKSRHFFSIQHNTILAYSRGNQWTFHPNAPIVREPFAETSLQTHFRNVDEHGRRYRRRLINGKEYIYYADDGRLVGSVWTDIPSMVANSPLMAESTGYPTQKPEKLLHRIITACSNPGDLVADFFCGSGTTLVVAEQLGRRWLGCDVGALAVHTTRKRLLDLRITDDRTNQPRRARSFEILSLDHDERLHWYETKFQNPPQTDAATARIAYRDWVLHGYGAHPIKNMLGRKGDALVLVGEVHKSPDASSVAKAAETAKQEGLRELHVLAWDWTLERGLPSDVPTLGTRDIDFRWLLIPREMMGRPTTKAQDMQFRDLDHLDVQIQSVGQGQEPSKNVRIVLKNFGVRARDSRKPNDNNDCWVNAIDYWAVDWDYREGRFTSRWRTYRSRRSRTLAVETAIHTYEEEGTYQVMVVVVDRHGNETSRRLHWTVP